MAFTGYKALDFSGIDKAIQGFQQRQQLASLGQNLDGTPEGYAKAAQALLQRGDTAAAANFFALGEKARERLLTESAAKNSPFAINRPTPTAPSAPTVQGVAPVGAVGAPGQSGYTPRPTFAGTEEEVQALEGSTGTPGQKVAARLINNGLTPIASAGLASNVSSESRANPTAVNPRDGRDGSDSIGIAQWNGTRAQALQQFAAARGQDWRDRDVQADFIAYELRTTEGRTGAALDNAQTPQQAATTAIGFFRPQGYTAANPLGALGAQRRVGNADRFVLNSSPLPADSPVPVQAAQGGPQFALGNAPPPSDQFTPPQQPSQVAQASQGVPAQDGLYTSTPTPALQAFINNPRVPDNLRTLMQQELARRGGGVPAAPAPVQLAQAPAQPGAPVSDVPVQGGAEVQGNFTIPGPNQLPPNDPRPDISTPQLLEVLANPRLAQQHPLAKFILDGRQKYSDENAPEKREQTRLATEKARLETQKLRREVEGEGARPMTPAERESFGVPRGQPAFMNSKGEPKFGPAGTTVKNEGVIPPGYRAIRDAEGNLERVEPIPGSKAEREATELAEKKVKGDRIKAEVGTTVGNALDDIDRLMSSATLPTTGAVGSRVAGIPGTAAHDIAQSLQTIGANISFSQLQQMREASPTGGALGAVSDTEQKLLQNSYAALSQSQSPEQFKTNLGRVRATFERIVHGRTLSAQERKTGGPMTLERAKGLREQAQQAIAAGAPRDAVLKRLKDDYGITPEGL